MTIPGSPWVQRWQRRGDVIFVEQPDGTWAEVNPLLAKTMVMEALEVLTGAGWSAMDRVRRLPERERAGTAEGSPGPVTLSGDQPGQPVVGS